jgi:hypothetical protein
MLRTEASMKRAALVFVFLAAWFSVRGAAEQSGRTAGRGSIPPIREFVEGAVVDESAGATANVSLGDLDQDGDLDIVLAKGRHESSVDRVLPNDGRGRFTARNLGPARDASYSALLSDIDGDADLGPDREQRQRARTRVFQ